MTPERVITCRLAIARMLAAKQAMKGGRVIWGKDEMDRRWAEYRAASDALNRFSNDEVESVLVNPRQAAQRFANESCEINPAGALRLRAWARQLPVSQPEE